MSSHVPRSISPSYSRLRCGPRTRMERRVERILGIPEAEFASSLDAMNRKKHLAFPLQAPGSAFTDSSPYSSNQDHRYGHALQAFAVLRIVTNESLAH